jgi:uncharacterized protein (TIGR02996 family)
MAAPVSELALLRERFAKAEARFVALEAPAQAAEPGRVLHHLLSAPSWGHAASVPHLLAVGRALARGVALLLETEAEEGPWRFLKAYTGFELICRAVCNHTGAGLPPELSRRLDAYQFPACPVLPAGPPLPPETTSELLGLLGLEARMLQPLKRWQSEGPPGDWPALLRLLPILALAVSRGLPVGEAAFPILVSALGQAAAALLAPLTAEAPSPTGSDRSAAPSPRTDGPRQRPARPVPAPLPVEPFLARYRGCEPLLHAIAERPWDDAPRLVLCDWLEEHGDGPARARARFIRLQCRQAASVIAGEQAAVGHQVDVLLERYGQAWRKGEPKAPKGWRFEFERGFLERGALQEANSYSEPGDLVGKLGRALGGSSLSIRSLHLGDATYVNWAFADLARLADLPALSGLHTLSFNRLRVAEDFVPTLAASPLVQQLSSLTWERIQLTGLEVLLKAAGEAGLARLALPDSGEWCAKLVAACPQLATLSALEITGWGAGAVVRPLAESLYLGELGALRVGYFLRSEVASSLGEGSRLRGLVHLDLDTNYIGITGAKALAGCATLAGLFSLGLANCKIKAEGTKALVRSPHLSRLRVLDLARNEIDDAGAQALAAAPLLGRLTFLSLGENELSDAGCCSLADSALAAGLEEMVLANNAITDRGARALAASPHLRRLRYLDLRGTKVTAKGASALASATGLPELTTAAFPTGAGAKAWRESARGRAED